MKRRVYGLLGAAAIAAFGAACKEDPLADTGGSLSRLDLEFSYREVVIGDSLRTFAIERDAINTPLPPTATVRSCNSAIATVSPVSDAPLQRSGFFVRAVTYGSTCVIAEAGALADTMQVATFPASILITGPDSIQSGAVTAFGYQYRDRTGNPVTGVPAPTWSTSDTTIAKALATPNGSVRGRSPGLVTLTVTGTGSPPGGVTVSKGITVVPGAFTGGISPASGDPGDTVKLTNAAGGPGFDSDTRVLVNGVRTFTFGVTFDSVKFIIPGVGAAGSVPLSMTNMGPEQAAQSGTLTSNTASLADPYDAVNDDPTTAPAITANGDYFVVVSGACVDGVGGAGTDCDDFFTITNAGGTSDTITVRLDWFTGADVDILWCNAACSAFVGNFAGATGANPEVSTVTIPAATTWRLWINLWDPHGDTNSIVRVRVTGKN